MYPGVHDWIAHYGYLGVFLILLIENLGVPFPAETTLMVSGIEWTKGTLIPITGAVVASLPLIFHFSPANHPRPLSFRIRKGGWLGSSVPFLKWSGAVFWNRRTSKGG